MPSAAINNRHPALADFDQFVRDTMAAWKVPGLAVGVVKDGAIIFLQGFGSRDIERGLEVTPNTRFALASGTKAFTTMALGMLADDGKLDWDAPVRTYMPSFRLYDPVVSDRLTPRDLVTHRSGLPRHDLAWYNSPHSRADLVRRLQYLEPNKDFRTVWQYQNLMYMTAGYLVEQISGQTWEQFVQQRIFEPLGMANSNFSVDATQASDDFARPYKEKDDAPMQVPYYPQGAIGPAGAINTSAADMASWLLLHLGNGMVGERRLISEAELREMHTPQMVIKQPAKYPELPHVSYGMGWFVEPYRGHDFVHHGGNIDGFSTMTTLMPRENLGVVVLCNLDGTPAPWITCLNAYERLLGLGTTPWNDRLKQERDEQKAGEAKGKEKSEADRVPGTQPSHPLASYAGDYEHPGYGQLSIALEDGSLVANFNGMRCPGQHYHYDTFEFRLENWDARMKAIFSANARGDIESVTLPMEQTVRDIVFTRVPDRALTDHGVLAQFAGEYEIAGTTMSIAFKNDTTLLARLPGQPDVELVPRQGAEFSVKGLSGFSIEFVRDEAGAVVEAIVTQPGGVFTAAKR